MLLLNSNKRAQLTGTTVGNEHTCGLRLSGRAVCWSYFRREGGKGKAGPFTQISAGWYHTCGLRRSGKAVCWGWKVYKLDAG